MPALASIRDLIRRLAGAQGLTPAVLAQRSGVAVGKVEGILKGTRQPLAGDLFAILAALGYSVTAHPTLPQRNDPPLPECPPPPADGGPWLTVAETAAALGVGEARVSQLLGEGRFPGAIGEKGGRRLIPQAAVVAFKPKKRGRPLPAGAK